MLEVKTLSRILIENYIFCEKYLFTYTYIFTDIMKIYLLNLRLREIQFIILLRK